jgi:hypothetical protein
MFIDVVPNGRSAPAVLLRESYREGKRILKRTLANLTGLPQALIDGLRVLLDGGTVVGRPEEALEIRRALPHGHVSAALATMRRLDLVRLLGRAASRERDLALALIASRVIAPGSKLATVRALSEETATSSLGRELGLGAIREAEIYAALDWLGEQQERIERALARRHLHDGTLVLYDVSSSYLEGRCCELARQGYSRDHRPDRLQIVYGLLCDRQGRPVAVEVFEGDTADPATLGEQIDKLKRRFGLRHVVLVGDRGMITPRASATSCARPASTGSPACARRRSRPWPRPAGRCSPRSSTSGTWRRSPAPTGRTSASSCAATPISPASGRASAPRCWPPPSATSRGSPPQSGASTSRCAARPRSAWPPARGSIATRWPSTSC